MKVYSNDSTIDIFEVVFRNLLEELICRISSAPSQKKKKKRKAKQKQCNDHKKQSQPLTPVTFNASLTCQPQVFFFILESLK